MFPQTWKHGPRPKVRAPTIAEGGGAPHRDHRVVVTMVPSGTAPAIKERLRGWFDQILRTDETEKFLPASAIPGAAQRASRRGSASPGEHAETTDRRGGCAILYERRERSSRVEDVLKSLG